jgi:hypothetical protein
MEMFLLPMGNKWHRQEFSMYVHEGTYCTCAKIEIYDSYKTLEEELINCIWNWCVHHNVHTFNIS